MRREWKISKRLGVVGGNGQGRTENGAKGIYIITFFM